MDLKESLIRLNEKLKVIIPQKGDLYLSRGIMIHRSDSPDSIKKRITRPSVIFVVSGCKWFKIYGQETVLEAGDFLL